MKPRPFVVALARASTANFEFGYRWFVWVPGSVFKRRWIVATHDAPRWV